jgi:protein-tyrosine phosphatase
VPHREARRVIDLHSHILPGVDDGARTIEDSVAMCRLAAAAGTTTIVATPHMLHPQYHVPGPVAQAKVEEVRAALAAANVPIDVVLAGEIHWSEDVPAGLASGELLPLCATRRYILFELPTSHVPAPFRDVCWQFHLAGIYPVLAHPERNAEFCAHPERLEPFHDAGILVQVTAMSLTGDFGRRARKVSERWLEQGVVDLIASDGHSCRSRPPTMDAAAKVVRKLSGPTAEEWLTREAPRRVLAGEPVLG